MSLFTNPAEDTHLPYSLQCPRFPDTGGKRTLSCHTALKVLDFLTLKRTLTWHTALNILVYMTLERTLTCHTALKVLVYITLERTLTCHTALKVLVYLTLERRTLTCHTAPKVLIYLTLERRTLTCHTALKVLIHLFLQVLRVLPLSKNSPHPLSNMWHCLILIICCNPSLGLHSSYISWVSTTQKAKNKSTLTIATFTFSQEIQYNKNLISCTGIVIFLRD